MNGLLLLAVAAAQPAPAEMPRQTLIQQGLAAFRSGDHTRARIIFRRLAELEVASAETMLGAMWARGLGGKRDDAVAAAWYIRAARRGYPPAQLALAHSFASGRGVPVDRDRALSLAKKAARRNQPGAGQFVLKLEPNLSLARRQQRLEP